jgi:Zn-finger nucleic acid-binding protein
MICPKCQSPMESVSFAGVTVDRCTGCQGIWFDARERNQLQQAKGSEVIDIGDARVGRKMDRITEIKCPRCDAPMTQVEDVDQHHITFEVCTACKGGFLDAGEFKDLKSYTLADYVRGLFRHKNAKPN